MDTASQRMICIQMRSRYSSRRNVASIRTEDVVIKTAGMLFIIDSLIDPSCDTNEQFKLIQASWMSKTSAKHTMTRTPTTEEIKFPFCGISVTGLYILIYWIRLLYVRRTDDGELHHDMVLILSFPGTVWCKLAID